MRACLCSGFACLYVDQGRNNMAVRGLAGPCARTVWTTTPGTRLPGTRLSGTRLPAQGYTPHPVSHRHKVGTRWSEPFWPIWGQGPFWSCCGHENVSKHGKTQRKVLPFRGGADFWPLPPAQGYRLKVTPPSPRHKVTPPPWQKVAQGLMRSIRGRRGSHKQPYGKWHRSKPT